MFDAAYILQVLGRNKWLILANILIAAGGAYAFLAQRPSQYKSTTLIATGFTTGGSQGAASDGAFDNLIALAQSQVCIKMLAIEMLRHDMMVDNPSGWAFRQPDKSRSEFTHQDRTQLLTDIIRIQLDSVADASPFDPAFDLRLETVALAYGYDPESLTESITIQRRGTSDFLQIDAQSELPVLSQYMANAFARRLTAYYRNVFYGEKRKKLEQYERELTLQKTAADSLQRALQEYLFRKRQAASGARDNDQLAAQLTALDNAKTQAGNRLAAANETLERLRKQLESPAAAPAPNSGDARSRVADKSNIARLNDRVRTLTEQSMQSGGKDPDIENQLAEARKELERALRSSASSVGRSGKQAADPAAGRDALLAEQAAAGREREAAEKQLQQIEADMQALRGQLRTGVAGDETVARLEAAQARAAQEAEKAAAALTEVKSSLEKSESPLNIAENANLPSQAEPDRRIAVSAGVGGFAGAFATLAILLMAFFDRRIHTTERFKKISGNLPLLATVRAVPLRALNFKRIFDSDNKKSDFVAFRENLRKLRGDLTERPYRRYLLVSTKSGEGKSFLLFALAYSLAAHNKRVLILDTNFKNPLPEAYTNTSSRQADWINNALRTRGLDQVFDTKRPERDGKTEKQLVEIIGNQGSSRSPSECLPKNAFEDFLREMETKFDYILLEAAALQEYNDAAELAPFVQRVIAVFNANSVIEAGEKPSIDYLTQLGKQFAGAVLTEVRR